jgi:hypothetical protein
MAGGGVRVIKNASFSEEKEAKRLSSRFLGTAIFRAMRKSFLVLFFKKEQCLLVSRAAGAAIGSLGAHLRVTSR